MKDYKKTSLNKVIRGAKRASYEKKDLYSILDNGYICQVAYLYQDRPIIIPTIYGRKDNQLFIHGSAKSRMLLSILKDGQATVQVYFIDALVIARSAFHHSANYRSANMYCNVQKVRENEKVEALKIITNHMIPNHWQYIRKPNEKELKATLVLSLNIEQASVKSRKSGVIDDRNDLNSEYWAGLVPIKTTYTQALPDESLKENIPVPKSILSLNYE